MIIVKKRAEIVRFGLFLALMGAMAYFVATKMETWRASQAEPPARTEPASGPIMPGALDTGPLQAALDRGTANGEDFFAEYRMDRERRRGALREELNGLMESQSADAEVKKQASQQLLEATRLASMEETAEQMVKAKGFADVVVHLSGSAAQVVVRAKELSQQQYLQVADMVSRVTSLKQHAIVVMVRDR